MLTKDKEVEGGSEGPQNVMCTNQFSPCVDFFCFGSTSPLVGWAVASLFWQSHYLTSFLAWLTGSTTSDRQDKRQLRQRTQITADIDLIILLNEELNGTSSMPTRDSTDSSSSRMDI